MNDADFCIGCNAARIIGENQWLDGHIHGLAHCEYRVARTTHKLKVDRSDSRGTGVTRRCNSDVVGAGGDRDTSKRPLMGKIAGELSSRLILTSDNPRSEDPEEIIRQMKEGVNPVDFKKLLVITNRKEAISTAYALAQSGDIILVAGKGHEKYQEIEGQKHPFDDKEILKDLMIQTT